MRLYRRNGTKLQKSAKGKATMKTKQIRVISRRLDNEKQFKEVIP